MIFSAEQLFSDDQAVLATAISTNVIDLGVPGTPYGAVAPLNQDVGKGAEIPVLIQVTEDYNNLTSVAVTIEVADDAGLTTNAKVLASQTFTLAELVAGASTCVRVLPDCADQRYLGVRYTLTGTAPTTGKFTAGITMGKQTNFTGA